MFFQSLQTRRITVPVLLAFLLTLPAAIFAQKKATKEGEPYLPPMQGFKMVKKEAADGKFETENTGGKNSQIVDVVHTRYIFKYTAKSGPKPPTRAELAEFYTHVFSKAAGRKNKEFVNVPGREFFAAGYVRDGKEIWINIAEFIMDTSGTGIVGYTIRYMDSPQPGYLTAEALDKELKKAGKVALDIHFETGENHVSEESLSQVNELASMLKKDLSIKVSIEGHTDKLGSATQNMELSEARAKTIAGILIKQGIDATRLSVVGWGWTKPVADNKSATGRAKNRRVEIVKK